MEFASCAPAFRHRIEQLAAGCGRSVDDVYAMWRRYAEDCRLFDQSPVLFEFEQWYAAELKPQPQN